MSGRMESPATVPQVKVFALPKEYEGMLGGNVVEESTDQVIRSVSNGDEQCQPMCYLAGFDFIFGILAYSICWWNGLQIHVAERVSGFVFP